jgi:DNA modification methylase
MTDPHHNGRDEARRLVSENRKYRVLTVEDAKQIAQREIGEWACESLLGFGLPEIDDRYHIWRVPLVAGAEKVGEIVIDARTSLVQSSRSSSSQVVADRLSLRSDGHAEKSQARRGRGGTPITRSALRNTLLCGDSEETLADLPAESVDLVFTSPPYFNARPDYTDYVAYEDYLAKIRKVLQQSHRLLAEGRFFVMNVAPVLLRRASRSEASRRIAVPFDMHRLFVEEGYEFIDDIIWEKPEGAGWATGRGRRFAADRNPLQYKAVPVTEYVLVYRKQTDRLIDWNIRNHPDQEAVERSKIADGYERTNVWRISPSSSRDHPAIFPRDLAERVVQYYSFEGDVVLDPFAGIGTTAEAAVRLKRRFVMAEMNPDYVEIMRSRMVDWLGTEAAEVLCVGCEPIDTSGVLI